MLTTQINATFTDIPLLANPPLHVQLATRNERIRNFERAYRSIEARYERNKHNHTGNPRTQVVIDYDEFEALVLFFRGVRSGWRH